MGMRSFVIIWIGQVVSILGSAMTGFAVTIWVYEGTEKATALALTAFFFTTPLLLLSPLAGVLVDRHNRKLMMILSDLASGLTTIAVLILHSTGNLEVWHLFVTNAISGAFQTLQWPAYSATISLMLPKEQYARANGMLELAGSGSRVFAPMLAGALLIPLGLTGILIIDIATFIFAIGALLFVKMPQPTIPAEGRTGQGSMIEEAIFGFRYILERPSLLGLQTVFMLGNFFVTVPFVIFAAMILARTGNDEMALGSVLSAGAIGGIAGGLAMTAWGGPRRRIHGVLAGWALTGVLGIMLVGVGRSLPVWIVGSFFGNLINPLINGSNQAIWQSKVAPDVQGRVFSTRRLIAWLVTPIATLMAGPLADSVLEPGMASTGGLVRLFGWLTGTGPGSGMALLFVAGGAVASMIALGAYAVPAVRGVETILPDHGSGEITPTAGVEIKWTRRHRVAVAMGALLMVALIIGLGWLQVVALSS